MIKGKINDILSHHSIWLIISVVLLQACNPTRYLSEGQKLYNGATINVHSDEIKGRDKSVLKENLTLLNRQRVNKKAALTAYYKLQNISDSTGFDYWWNNLLKEEPEFFDTLTIANISQSMTNYLKRSGYFNAKVTYTTKVKGKYGKVHYDAYPGKSYHFNDITFEVNEPKLATFLAPYWDKSILQTGEVVSDVNFTREKQRVTSILQNNGFYFFDPAMFAPLIADSVSDKVNATFIISESTDPTVLNRFRIGRINIHSDFDPNFSMLYRMDSMYRGYRFLQISPKFKVKPSTILQYVYIKPGDYYSKDKFDRTFRQLNRLGLYRYVNIRESRDEDNPGVLNVDILLPPTKTLNFNAGLDLNKTDLRSGLDKFQSFALQTSVSINKRNLFNGGELLNTNIDYGIEQSFKGGPQLVSRHEIRLRNTLFFPRFLDYLGVITGLSKIKTKNGTLLNKNFIEALDDRVTTNIGLDFEFVNFKQWYRYFNINGSYGFQINPDPEHQYLWNNFGFSYFIPQTFSRYEEILAQNVFLAKSFTARRFFTGFLLRNFEFNYNKAFDANEQTRGYNVSTEFSGFEINLLNKLFSPDKEWLFGNEIEFTKFWKLSASASNIKRLSDKIYGAAKLTVGAAHTFGSTTTVPYIKQFEIGGPFSIRGWPIRKLGPGGYKDEYQLTNFPKGPYYQTGDIKIELISEIRFPIYYLFKGAIFLDAGNVWSWNKSDDREGAKFNADFLKDIAIGSGFGIRLDLTLFVLRLDIGTQIKNPYPINGREFFPNRNLLEVWRNLVWNIAVNYPF